jgi:hypothetical protein
MNDLNILTLQALRQNDEPAPVDLEEVLITPVEWKIREGKMIFPKVEYTYYKDGNVETLRLERVSGNEAPKWDMNLYGGKLVAETQPDHGETLRMLNFITRLVKAKPSD